MTEVTAQEFELKITKELAAPHGAKAVGGNDRFCGGGRRDAPDPDPRKTAKQRNN